MNDEARIQELREARWRRNLTEPEKAELKAWLSRHPESETDWELEEGLNLALSRLANAPLASNFTSRVLQQIEREDRASRRRQRRAWEGWLLRWLPRTGFAAVVGGVALFSYHQVETSRLRHTLEGVEVVSSMPSVPSPQILENFDAIRALDRTPPADQELLSLLQ